MSRTYLRFREQELYARSSNGSGDSATFELDAEEKRIRISLDARNTGGTLKGILMTEDRLYLNTNQLPASQPAVLGTELKTLLTDLNDTLKTLGVDVPALGLLAPNGAVTGQASGVLNTSTQTAIDNITGRLDDMLLEGII